MVGVRGHKTRKTRVVKLIGKKADLTYRPKGSKSNHLTGHCDTSMALKHTYASMGIAKKAGMSEKEKQQALATLPEGKKRSLPPVPPERPSRAKYISDLEHGDVDNLVEKHGLDYIAMSLDKKLNPFQLTPKQLRKKVSRVVTAEQEMFPEKFAALLDGDGKLDLSGNISDSDDDKW